MSEDHRAEGRTITVLMGDIVGSTANWLAAPDAMSVALEAHDDIVATAVADAGGVVFKHTGDGFLAQFEEASRAVAAARSIRTALGGVAEDVRSRLGLRLAVDTGWATSRRGDWFGPVVNRVARLTDLSSPSGVILTQVARETAREAVPAEALGSITLRSHRDPVAVFGVDGATITSSDSVSGSLLPAAATSFIGREMERARLAGLLDESRLVTIVATGGAGKTRLAIAVAADQTEATGFVDLVPCRDEIDVARRFALGAGIEEAALSSETDPHAVIGHLADLIGATDLVLVVDNCEHVLDAVRTAILALLARCPSLRIVATSRERLDIAEEQVFHLPMLSVGVDLFLARAAGHGIDIDDTSEVRAAVAEICTRLDGLPLAIEIAAARLRDASLREILADLDRSVLESGGGRPEDSRRRTMRDVVGWSYASLPEQAQALFERLSLFEGAFGAGDLGLFASADPDDLRLLVRRSLVLQERSGLDLHYRLLEPVRQVARGLLDERGSTDEAHRELITGFLVRFESEYGDSWWSWDHLEPASSLLPTAWSLVDWLVGEGDDLGVVRLLSKFAGAAIVFSGASRVASVLSERTDVIGSLAETEQAEALVLYALSGIGAMQLDHAIAGVVALFDLDLPATGPRSFATRSAALSAMNNAYREGGDLQFPLDLLIDARTIAAQSGSRYERAAVEAYVGWRHLLAGAWTDAEAASRGGLDFVEPTNVWHVVLSANLGMALVRQGRHAEALSVARSHPDFGRYYYMGDMLGLVEILALAGQGDLPEAYARFAAMVERVLASNHPGHRSDLVLVWAWLCLHDGRAGDAAWVSEGPLATRGPHTLQLMTGLELAVGGDVDRTFQADAMVAETWLPARLSAARDLALERSDRSPDQC